jgi:Nif-specific regulatory protein
MTILLCQPVPPLIGKCPAIEALRSVAGRVADTDLPILIRGEVGSGRETLAQTLHSLSRRAGGPFVAVRCGEIAENGKLGNLALTAAGGTLFLNEIGDLDLAAQADLLPVLDEQTSVRLLASTSQDLGELARQQRFRADLLFRLGVVTLDLPPLRERGEDILLLAEHFLSTFCKRARCATPEFSAAARAVLLNHPWPGNVAELRNLMERLSLLRAVGLLCRVGRAERAPPIAPEKMVGLAPLDPPYKVPTDQVEGDELSMLLSPGERSSSSTELGRSLAEATQRFQVETIRRSIADSAGNMTLAAARLGLHRSNLYRKMRQLGMEEG